MSKNKKKASDIVFTAVLLLLMLIGIAVFLYPSFSSWWNERTQTRVIESYNKAVGELDTSEKDSILARAAEYNAALSALSDPLSDYEEIPDYNSILDITGTGIMGYIDIPKIGVHLPVYHGTSPEVLNVAVGHLQGSSLPIGGTGSHSVISAHRGLPSAKLFTELDQLTEDDRFSITILDEVLTYEIDQISVVLPHERDLLRAEPGRDLVTLMTCTPYGINTHRLLVRGRRIDDIPEEENVRKVRIPADAVLVDETDSLLVITVPLAILLIAFWLTGGRHRYKKHISEYSVMDITEINIKDGGKSDSQDK